MHTEQHWLIRQAHDQKIGYPNNLKEAFEDTKGAIRIQISKKIWLDFWCFQQYASYIMVTSFSGGGSRSTRREPPTLCKQLVNFITCGCESNAPFL